MRLTRALLAVGLVVTALGASPLAAHAATVPIKIMPLGASVTYGTNSTDGNGYREALRKLLVTNAGLTLDYVGSVKSGNSVDPDNEGHPGLRIDQIAAGVDGWLATYAPDVVLLNVGTNDTIQDYQLPTAPDRLHALIDRILTDDPAATVMFSTLVPTPDATRNAKVQAFDAKLPAIAQAEAAAGKKVHLVDLNGGLTNADIGADQIHPTDGGYDKLANVWYSALHPILGAGKDWPLFKEDFGDAAPPLTWTNSVAGSLNVGGYCCGLTTMETGRRAELAHGGTYALMYSGNDLSTSQSYSYNRLFDVDLVLTTGTVLAYWIYPQTADATSVAIDLTLNDGRTLRDSGAVDQYGVRAHPQYQGQGGHLALNQWNLVQVDLSRLAGGTVDQIRLGYDQPANTGLFRGYVDDLTVVAKA